MEVRHHFLKKGNNKIILDYWEEKFRFLLVGNWQILRKQREGHLRDGTASLETRECRGWELIKWSFDQKGQLGWNYLKYKRKGTDSLRKRLWFPRRKKRDLKNRSGNEGKACILLSRVPRNNLGNNFSQKYRITVEQIDIFIFFSHGQDFQFPNWTCFLH